MTPTPKPTPLPPLDKLEPVTQWPRAVDLAAFTKQELEWQREADEADEKEGSQ